MKCKRFHKHLIVEPVPLIFEEQTLTSRGPNPDKHTEKGMSTEY